MRPASRLGAYLAAQFSREHGLSLPATEAELVAACERMRLRVMRSVRLGSQGFYVTGEVRFIALGWSASVLTLAHEVGHHLLCDHDDTAMRYRASGAGKAKDLEEAICRAFAAYLVTDLALPKDPHR